MRQITIEKNHKKEEIRYTLGVKFTPKKSQYNVCVRFEFNDKLFHYIQKRF